jgi:diguanylate cyclase (GGDEF)-like protein/PAS domain S-box-containing protein
MAASEGTEGNTLLARMGLWETLLGQGLFRRRRAPPPPGRAGGPAAPAREADPAGQRLLLALLAVAVAGILALAVFGYWQGGRVFTEASYASANSVPSLVEIEDARTRLGRFTVLLHRFLETADPGERAGLEKSLRRERAAFLDAIHRYEALLPDETGRSLLITDRALWSEYEQAAMAIVEAAQMRGKETALARLADSAELAEALNTALDVHMHYNAEWARQGETQAAGRLADAVRQGAGFVAVLIGVLLSVGYAIGSRLMRQVERMKRLARENAMCRTMIETAADLVVMVHDSDDGGRIVYANGAACRHFGVDRKTLLRRRPPDWDAGLEPSRIAEIGVRAKQHGVYRFDTRHRVAGGAVIPVEVTVNPFEYEGEALAVSLVRDLRPRLAEEARKIQAAKEEELRRLARFADSAPGFMYTYRQTSAERPGAMLFASQAIEEIFGLKPEDVAESIAPLRRLVRLDDLPRVVHAKRRSAEALEPFEMEYRIHHPAKGERWLLARSMPEPAVDGAMLWHGFILDITDRKHMEEQLRLREQEFRTLAQNAPDIVVRYDRECRRRYISPAYDHASGNTVDAALGKRPTESWGRASMEPAVFEQKLRQIMDSGEPGEIELDWHTADGEYICYWLRLVPEFDSAGRPAGVLSIARDASEIKRAQKALQWREQELRSLLDNTPDSVARYGRDCRRLFANRRLLAEFGAPLERVLGKTPSEFPGGESMPAYEQAIREVFDSGEAASLELKWRSGSGKTACTHLRLTPEHGMDGQVASVLAVGRDISEIDEYRRRIHRLAFFDTLTDLPNRSLLAEQLREAVEQSAWHGQQFGLMLLDLDHFKMINDTLGHAVGDQLLCQVAERLQACVRNCDTVSRLGGDEFAVLLPDVRENADLSGVAARIVEAFGQPFQLSNKELFVSSSIGIALYPADSADIDALFKYADSAMYAAKKQGRNNFQFYSSDLTVRSVERMHLELALRKALANQELELYYQPQVDAARGRLAGAEALLRWNRGEQGLVGPQHFIGVAEETGLIVPMGEWVLASACRAAVEWNAGREAPLRIAVNLSTRQFMQNDLLASVRRILEETGCRPQWLKLEVTESLLLDDGEEILATLNQFRDMGLELSIDDFGTGYSALSYLNRFPVSQIKIDRSFVSGIPQTQDKAELVKAIISIAQALHLEVVAEGVENRLQADYLLAHGCPLLQGYLFGKPMPHAEFAALLAEGRWYPASDG